MKYKKNCIRIVCMILAVSMLTVAAFAADGGKKRGEMRDNKQREERSNATKIPSFERRLNEDYLTEIKEKIEALEQQETKDNLNLLIEEYSDLVEKVKEQAESEEIKDLMEKLRGAEKNLRDSLKDAGIIEGFKPNGDSGRKNTPTKRTDGAGFRFKVDTDKLTEAVSAITDETVKVKLNELIEKYKASCAAIEEKYEEDNAEQLQLREEVKQAYEQLASALKDAGIELKATVNVLPSKPSLGDDDAKDKINDINKQENNNIDSSSSQSSSEIEVVENSSFLDKLISWFKNKK